MYARPPVLQPYCAREEAAPVVKDALVPYLANMVFMGTLSARINLPALVRKNPHIELNTAFASAKAHFNAPRLTCLIFPSGKVVITGARNRDAAGFALLLLSDSLRPDYPRIRVKDLRLKNFTCTVYTGFFLNLAQCSQDMPDICRYVPEKFPGAHIATGMARCTQIAFPSGRCVTTGARSAEQAFRSLLYTESLLKKYRSDELIKAPGKRARVEIVKDDDEAAAVEALTELQHEELMNEMQRSEQFLSQLDLE